MKKKFLLPWWKNCFLIFFLWKCWKKQKPHSEKYCFSKIVKCSLKRLAFFENKHKKFQKNFSWKLISLD
jgi:hypothetical protein